MKPLQPMRFRHGHHYGVYRDTAGQTYERVWGDDVIDYVPVTLVYLADDITAIHELLDAGVVDRPRFRVAVNSAPVPGTKAGRTPTVSDEELAHNVAAVRHYLTHGEHLDREFDQIVRRCADVLFPLPGGHKRVYG